MFFYIIHEFSFVFGWISGKMGQNSKFWAMSRVLRSDKETPRSGEGPHSGEGPPRRSEAKKESLSILGFAAAKQCFVVALLFTTREQKVGKIGRFFGDFSVIDWSGEEKSMEKSFKKISAKNRRFFGKIPIISDKSRFFLEKKFSDFFPGSKNVKKMLLTGFEPTQNAWKWHPPTTKPLIALIIYNANFFYILLLFIYS